MPSRIKAGDNVRLNNFGLKSLFGSVLSHAHMKSLQMRVTYVAQESMTNDCETHEVEVDNPDTNRFLLNDRCFNRVPSQEIKVIGCQHPDHAFLKRYFEALYEEIKRADETYSETNDRYYDGLGDGLDIAETILNKMIQGQ